MVVVTKKTIIFTSLHSIKRMSDRINFHHTGKTGRLQVLWFWYGFLILMGLFRTIDRVAQILSWRFRFGRLVVILKFFQFCWFIWGSKCSNGESKILKTTFDFTWLDLSWPLIVYFTSPDSCSRLLNQTQTLPIWTNRNPLKWSWVFCRYQLIKWKIRRYFVKTENDEPVHSV